MSNSRLCQCLLIWKKGGDVQCGRMISFVRQQTREMKNKHDEHVNVKQMRMGGINIDTDREADESRET